MNSMPSNTSTNVNGQIGVTDAYMRDFQMKIFNMFQIQNKVLMDLKEKNNMLTDTLNVLLQEIKKLRTTIGNSKIDAVTTASSKSMLNLLVPQNITAGGDTLSVDDMIMFLYGKTIDFKYKFVLNSHLEFPLYRERNFSFSVSLVDMEDKPIANSNRIPLSIAIYTSENPPKYVDANTSGNKIMKGFVEKDLNSGMAVFEKIQIKEVTSHFRNGWVFLVVYPKMPSFATNIQPIPGQNIVDYNQIKPLVIDRVIVKAKKIRERD